MDKFYSYIYNTIITIIIVVIGMIIVKSNNSNKIVKVNLVEITNYFTQVLEKEPLTEVEENIYTTKKISEVVKTNLEVLINEYARSHKVTVIQSQAIIAGNIPDITALIINELQEKIK